MQLTAAATTYVSSVVLFEPRSLPDDFDQTDLPPIEIIYECSVAEKLAWIQMPKSGHFRLLAFVNERVSPGLTKHLASVSRLNHFHIEGAELVFAGAEFAYSTDDSVISQNPTYGQRLPVAPGHWDVEFFAVHNSHESVDAEFHDRVSRSEYATFVVHSWLIAVSMMAMFVSLVSFFLFPLSTWLMTFLPATGVVVAIAACVHYSRAYRSAKTILASIEGQFPDLVAVLNSSEPSARAAESS